MPRILLIVDEFQEFFVEDDKHRRRTRRCCSTAWCGKAGRSASTCCSARRRSAGRTRWPAARIGQMAVRIALQCSEADAHLILSEDNTAARLLTRPGEAIYNDANGLFEGQPSVPGRLAARRRARRVSAADRASLPSSGTARPPPPIVFEGNVAGRSARQSAAGRGCCAADYLPASCPCAAACLAGRGGGIKDPTRVVFRGRAGQPADRRPAGRAGLGILASVVIALAGAVPSTRAVQAKARVRRQWRRSAVLHSRRHAPRSARRRVVEAIGRTRYRIARTRYVGPAEAAQNWRRLRPN